MPQAVLASNDDLSKIPDVECHRREDGEIIPTSVADYDEPNHRSDGDHNYCTTVVRT